MSDVKSIKINDDARDVKDALARETIGDVSELHTSDKTTLVDAINEVFDNDSDDDGKIGNLSNLMTDSKSNLVGAVNEVYQSADDANDAIGDLSNLTTQNKGNIVGAINEVVGDVVDTNADVTELTTRVIVNEGNIGDLTNLHTTDKDNLVEAINETLDSVGDIGDVNLPDLTNIQNTVDAINGVIAQTNSDLTTLTNRVQSDEGDIAQNSSDIVNLNTAVGEIELVTDEGYTDLSDAVKQLHDNFNNMDSSMNDIDNRLGINGGLSEPYVDQIVTNREHIGEWSQLNVPGRHLVDVCNYLQTQIGTLSNLSTTDKTSLVAAINEVAQSGGGSGGSGGSGGTSVVASYTCDSTTTYATALNNLFSQLANETFTDNLYVLAMSYISGQNNMIAVCDSYINGSSIRFKNVIGSGSQQSNATTMVEYYTLQPSSIFIRYTSYPRDYTDYSNTATGECTIKVLKIGASGGSGGGNINPIATYTVSTATETLSSILLSMFSTITAQDIDNTTPHTLITDDSGVVTFYNLVYHNAPSNYYFTRSTIQSNTQSEIYSINIQPGYSCTIRKQTIPTASTSHPSITDESNSLSLGRNAVVTFI